MWKTLSDWLFAFFNMSRELQEHRDTLRLLEARLRDVEESIRLLAQDQRHGREMEQAARDKLLLQVQQEVARLKSLPASRRRRKP